MRKERSGGSGSLDQFDESLELHGDVLCGRKD